MSDSLVMTSLTSGRYGNHRTPRTRPHIVDRSHPIPILSQHIETSEFVTSCIAAEIKITLTQHICHRIERSILVHVSESIFLGRIFLLHTVPQPTVFCQVVWWTPAQLHRVMGGLAKNRRVWSVGNLAYVCGKRRQKQIFIQ